VTLWSVAAYLLLPYAFGSLVWRGLRYRAYWLRWPERFGFVRRVTAKRVIWVHAVSVGEVRSAAALIEALAKRFPLFWLLFEPNAVRITPPLVISDQEIKEGCTLIIKVLNEWNN
jgi:3-deoxy-D-manno-octulosonic-acid transferase